MDLDCIDFLMEEKLIILELSLSLRDKMSCESFTISSLLRGYAEPILWSTLNILLETHANYE